MQADDDERRDLERILSARPREDGADRDERREALRRLGELEAEDAPPGASRSGAQTGAALFGAQPGAAHPGTATDPRLPLSATALPLSAATGSETPESPAEHPDRRAPRAPHPRRRRLVLAAAIVGGAAVGAIVPTALLLPPPADPVTTPTASATPADRFAALVEGWEPTTDVPPGLALLAGEAVVYGSGFDTAENDRLLITEPNGTTVCLAVQRPDASFFAGCTGSEAFFAGEPLRVSGTTLRSGAPVYTQILLRPDGTIEGGYQLVPESPQPEAAEPGTVESGAAAPGAADPATSEP
ncbi:hypothetical protein C5D34_10455 [Rathayibacter sp. AY1B1]|uniref:hypothetical protein n=1 Tax=unclassified Rathayibacter TaxID=2609250 RepID=UPI000CE81D80|nr:MULTISPECIES: hypothetical protein [unclassified Rathayibacter]PPI24153.1 hypothetical protein C5D08_02835 [Rathayibacter sp. AY1B6]PPI33765.1 hypothetical protein C5D34_10455 [Rathayibacter sp. AY1B1]